MRLYYAPTVAEAYGEMMTDLVREPEYVTNPRGMEVKEFVNCAIEVSNVLENTYANSIRGSQLKYLAAEILWYLSGTSNPAFIENYASLWKSLHNPDGTVNSAYGNLIFRELNPHGMTQYQWVIEMLKADKDSRQAFMHFNKPQHQWIGNKDQVCTLNAVFHIRGNKLYMTVTMRSNDAVYGFMTDWTFFTVLMQQVRLHLMKYYPDLELGSYTHLSHSMHLYQRHYELVEKMVQQPFESSSIPGLNSSVIRENGNVIFLGPEDDKLNTFTDIFVPINKGQTPDWNSLPETGNRLVDWCVSQLK